MAMAVSWAMVSMLTSTLACCWATPAFSARTACDFAEVVQHLRKRKHQRGGKAIIVTVVAIAVIHASVNLRIIFRFSDVHIFALLIKFADGFTDSRMPVTARLTASFSCSVRGGFAGYGRHAAI